MLLAVVAALAVSCPITVAPVGQSALLDDGQWPLQQ